MPTFRLIVAGGRDFDDTEMLNQTLDIFCQKHTEHKIEIISGDCRGADLMGECYAHKNHYFIQRFSADWDKWGKAAGPIRNKQMVEFALEADEGMLVAFWDGQSKGTKNIIDTARRYGLPVYISYYY